MKKVVVIVNVVAVVAMILFVAAWILDNTRGCFSAEYCGDGNWNLGRGMWLERSGNQDRYVLHNYETGEEESSIGHRTTLFGDLEVVFDDFTVTINRGDDVASISNSPSALEVIVAKITR